MPPERIRKLICTHHHPDHFGASKRLQELTGAAVYLHRVEHEISKRYNSPTRSEAATRFFLRHGVPLQRFVRIPSPGEFWAQLYQPATPDHLMEDGDCIQLGDFEIEVIATPGHTPGHCVLYLRSHRLLIAGDHLLPKITPHIGVFPDGPPNPLADFLASQRKVQPLDVSLVLPAHGGIYRDHRYRSAQIIHHHDYRMQEMLDIVRHRSHTAYDVAAEAFGFSAESPLTIQFPATFETLAHLEFLCSQGRVVREERGEQVVYRAR